MKKVLYLCDGLQCEHECGNCTHTTDVEHAVNFIERCADGGQRYYVEEDREEDED